MRGDHRGRRRGATAAGRRVVALALGLLGLSALWATPALGAVGPSENGASVVVHQIHSRPHLRAFWTPGRIKAAEPLTVLRYDKPGGRMVDAGSDPTPAAADPSANGTDTGDPTLYPNRVNGIVLFFYGPDEYQCSGSVVNSAAGNVVLTAGHCVIDPGPGTNATNILFIPGYRDGTEPYGEWPATSFVTTSQWQSTAATGDPNDADEAGDMAMLKITNRPSDGAALQSVVGSVGIAFDQARSQTYMQYGYPAAFPYDGTRLYETTSTYKGADPSYTPNPMAISSDFTGGSSGGPWLVGSSPVALSVTDYTYDSLPGYMFGPYFGSIAQQLYSAATSSASTAVSPASTPSSAFSIRLLRRNRRRGIAVLGVSVPGPGKVDLSGAGLRFVSRTPAAKGTVALRVRARGSTLTELRDAGHVLVLARISFRPTGGSTARKARELSLVKR